ncbi:homocysteine-responsive endoplasmic reticulum-resident ubiquitin-like domain member 2 protein, partial [Ruditapes philippinarum]|uniref:homocysteine-responsive endoplasmic reticulum-resident ubiquitin-like domain member 2 protein n=1 Tax=Ruditapes philippinarum TaxID=129788 RepID=UPI00295B5D2F
NETQQKLIYSGKLLQDHLTLKEVLRQFDDGSTKHTVHLVCSASPGHEYRSTPFPNTNSVRNTIEEVERELLQFKSFCVQLCYVIFYSPQMPAMNQFPGNMNQMGAAFPAGFPGEAAMFAGMMPDSGMAYSPEQYLWMQQMYAQYMAQYMQYYQQGVYPVPPNTPVTPPVGQAAPQQQNGQENVNQAQENVEEMEDLDEEFRQRDWLDYLYTFSRFMVLLGIVYFYSNITRFLMVAAFFLVVYAYQMGFFFLRRRRVNQPNAQNVNNQPNNPPNEPQVPNNQPNNPPNEPQVPNNQQQEENNTEQENNVNTEEGNPTETPAQTVTPPEPGVLQVSWTFVSTFFTSLFPSPPPAVNVN